MRLLISSLGKKRSELPIGHQNIIQNSFRSDHSHAVRAIHTSIHEPGRDSKAEVTHERENIQLSAEIERKEGIPGRLTDWKDITRKFFQTRNCNMSIRTAREEQGKEKHYGTHMDNRRV